MVLMSEGDMPCRERGLCEKRKTRIIGREKKEVTMVNSVLMVLLTAMLYLSANKYRRSKRGKR